MRTRSDARERPARGGSRLEISRLATMRSPGCERETGQGGSRLREAVGHGLRSPDRVRERDRLKVGGFVRGEAGLGWLGVAGRAEKESRKREESERA